jgi:hypothetical protein
MTCIPPDDDGIVVEGDLNLAPPKALALALDKPGPSVQS